MSEQFHEDPSQNLRMENEILKLKMQAEYGAQVFMEPEVSPELEAEFLQQIYAFEEAWKDAKMISISELLGNPAFIPERELDDRRVAEELARAQVLLEKNNIHLDVPPDKSPRTVYRFITEILMKEEVDDLRIDGLVRHFFLGQIPG